MKQPRRRTRRCCDRRARTCAAPMRQPVAPAAPVAPVALPLRRGAAAPGHDARAEYQPGAAAGADAGEPERRAAQQTRLTSPLQQTQQCPGAAPVHGRPRDAGFPGRRPARRAAHVRRDQQRPQHRHRPEHSGHGRRVAARRAVGPGARHHPARQQAWLQRRRQHRPHRAAARCWRRRTKNAAS